MLHETVLKRGRDAVPQWLATHWPLVIGVASLLLPTLLSLAEQHWSIEAGAHAPLVLVTGGWLVWRELQVDHRAPRPGSFVVSVGVLLPSLVLYVFGRAYDYLSLEAAGLYAAVLTIIYSRTGSGTLKDLWFPLLYLAFAIPFPGWALDVVTTPLKDIASSVTTSILQGFGLPVAREGVTLYVAQYQLLVEDACAGLNSIIGLMSMGLFYTYIVHGSSPRYCMLLASFILPIAVFANVIRVMILVLLTYYAGDEVAQGFLHEGAGLVTFGSALLLVFAVDSALSRLVRPRVATTA